MLGIYQPWQHSNSRKLSKNKSSNMAASVPNVKLNNGYELPAIGLGTWLAVAGEVEAAVKIAIDAGYRHFDTSLVYQNEKEVGKAIKEKIQTGIVTRDELFITTKLWCSSHAPSDVIPACKSALERLQLDYLDLYLVHWPMAYKEEVFKETNIQDFQNNWFFKEIDKSLEDPTTLEENWGEMEECVKLGLTRSIGLSNYNSQQIERILKVAKIKPVTNQVECHPYLNQKELIAFCKERKIVITAYAPIGSPSKPWSQDKPQLLQDSRLLLLAEKHRKSPAQIILRYLIQLGTVPIPKSSNPGRIQENLDVFDFTLTSEELAVMDSFNINEREFKFLGAKNHRDYPFNIPY